MITKAEFEKLIELKFIALVRVVTVPQENAWCIDVILRRPLRSGYKVETVVAGRDANSMEVDRFDSLDSAANYLHSTGIKSFVVDQKEASAGIQPTRNVTNILEPDSTAEAPVLDSVLEEQAA